MRTALVSVPLVCLSVFCLLETLHCYWFICTRSRPLQQPRITVLAQLPRHLFAMFANNYLQEIENKDVASKLTRLPDPAGRQSV
jgi:hypothetical protein